MPAWSVADLLPGLWFLALAAALVGCLHRFYDRLGGRELAAFGLVLAIFFGRFLFGGALLLPLDGLRGQPPFLTLAPTAPHGNALEGDLLQLVAPAGVEVRRAVAAGRWPLWSPHTGAGMPLLADPQALALQPLAVAALPFAVARAAAVTAALKVLLALVFSFLFLQRQGLGRGASLFGALAWGLSGFLMLWLGWPLSTSAAWLPAVLYGLARVIDRGGRRDLLLATASLAGLLLAGHLEALGYCLAVAAAFVVARLRAPRDGERPRRKVLAAAGASLALAAGWAAPALAPTAAYLPQTLRAARLAEPAPPPVASSALARAELRLLPLAAPNVFGNDRYNAYWGPANVNEDASGFAGTLTLLLVLCALVPAARRRPQELAFAACAAVALLVVAQVPGLIDLLALLPGGSSSGYHHRLLLPLAFCLVYFAACELDRRAAGEREGRPAVVALGLATLGLSALVAWAYLAHPHPQQPDLLAPLRIGWLHWQLRFLAVGAFLLVWPRTRRAAPYAFAALVAAELLLLARPAHPPAPERLDFPATPPIELLAAELGTGRFVGEGLAFTPNLGAVYGLADARLYNPLAPAAYLGFLAPVITGWSGEVPLAGTFDHPLWDRLGVRYVVVAPGKAAPPPLATVLADAAGNVWERPLALPLAYLAASDGRPLSDLTMTRWEASRISGSLAPGSGGGRLATSVYQDGGWKVLLDGRRLKQAPTEGPFVAAEIGAAKIGAGASRLEIVYRPLAFVLGSGLAALALAAAVAWWLRPPEAG